jgi:hypothetical protein
MPPAPVHTLSGAQRRCLALARAHGPLQPQRAVWCAGDTIAAGEVTIRALVRKGLMVVSYTRAKRERAYLTPRGKWYAETAVGGLRGTGSSARE